jgi:hypothetical protein
LVVLVGASLVATVTRYVALKTWVFAGARRRAAALEAAARAEAVALSEGRFDGSGRGQRGEQVLAQQPQDVRA